MCSLQENKWPFRFALRDYVSYQRIKTSDPRIQNSFLAASTFLVGRTSLLYNRIRAFAFYFGFFHFGSIAKKCSTSFQYVCLQFELDFAHIFPLFYHIPLKQYRFHLLLPMNYHFMIQAIKFGLSRVQVLTVPLETGISM